MQDNQSNITKYIHAKISEKGIQLTYNTKIIGNILWQDIQNIEIKNDYFLKDGKIYRITKKQSPILQYVDGCDQGWC